MKNQPMILLVVAVGCGLVAMLGVRQALNQKPESKEETVSILSAVAAIGAGECPNEVNTKFVDVALTAVPEGAITTMDDVAERSLKLPVMPGDWILKAKLSEPGDKGVVASIPAGMAAITIPVNGETSHSGMLLPGHRIDLLMTYSDSSGGPAIQKTMTVLECVQVLAVDNRVFGTDKGGEATAKNISLLVTREQGKAVTLANKVGILSTILRPKIDADNSPQGEISQDFLTSSFMASNEDAATVVTRRSNDEVLPEPAPKAVEDKLSIDQMIGNELDSRPAKDPGGSEPVLVAEVPKNIWTMEIYEGETVRREDIELPADPAVTGGASGFWGFMKKP